MEIKSNVDETETVELRDYDIYFVSGGLPLTLTLEPEDGIVLPTTLAAGDIVISYGKSGERGRVNGKAIAWISERQRTVTRKVKPTGT